LGIIVEEVKYKDSVAKKIFKVNSMK